MSQFEAFNMIIFHYDTSVPNLCIDFLPTLSSYKHSSSLESKQASLQAGCTLVAAMRKATEPPQIWD